MGVLFGVGDFGLEDLLLAAQSAGQTAVQAKQQAELAASSVKLGKDLGFWNVATNSPSLSASSQGVAEGGFYVVTVGGASPFAGANFSVGTIFNPGDQLAVAGNTWYRRPFAVGDSTITPTKTSFIRPGKNLFNPSAPGVVDNAFLENTGIPVTAAENPTVASLYGYTDFIEVTPGNTYTGWDGINGMRKTTYYDASKTVMSGQGSTNAVTTFTVPAGVKYVRVTYWLARKGTFQFEQSSAATTFEAYAAKIQGVKLDAANLILDANNLFTTAAEKALWNAKLPTSAVLSAEVGASKNIFNPALVINNRFIIRTNGDWVMDSSATGWKSAGPYPVTAGLQYTVQGFPALSKGIRFENAASGLAGSHDINTNGFTFTVPAGANQMYITIQRNDETVDLTKVQIELGTVATTVAPYVAGRLVLKSVDGKDIPIRTVAGKTGDANGNLTLSLADVGGGNLDNTKDIDKPVSVPQAAAINLRVAKSDVVTKNVGKTKNMFNPTTSKDNYFLEPTGVEIAGALYGYSDFIEVTPELPYSGSDGVNGMRKTTYFDTNKVVVIGGATNAITTFTPPTGVKYVRVTYWKDRKSTFQFEQAAAPSSYVAYNPGTDTVESIMGAKVGGGSAVGTEKVNIDLSQKILVPGCSYVESMYALFGKSWPNKLANQTDWLIANTGVSGSRMIDIANRLRTDTAVFGVKPSNWKPTYVVLANNGNEYFPNNGETLDLYMEQFRIAAEAVEAWGAKPIVSTDYHVNGNRYLESQLKNWADRHKYPYMGIGWVGEKIISKSYQGFWGGSHPGTRTNAFYWTELLYYINQLPRPSKSVKVFRPRNSGQSVDALNYDTIPQRFERWIELNVGEMSLNTSDGSEAYYDRLNEGTTVDPSDENNIITTYHIQTNNNEYVALINGTAVAFTDYSLIELIIDRVRVESFVIKIKGDAGLAFSVKNNNDPAKYESVGRDRELVFQVTKSVFDAFTDAVGTKFTSSGVKAGSVQFAYQGKMKSYAMGKGWFLCFTADANVDQADRVTATTSITRVSDSSTVATVKQQSSYRYGYSYFAGLNKPKGGWKSLTSAEVVYANGEYTITLPASSAQYFEFDKLKLLVSKSGAFNLTGIEAEYTGGVAKAGYVKEVEVKPFGTELIPTRGFDANWETSGGWTSGGNALVSMPSNVRDYPPYLTNTSHIELGFDSDGFPKKTTRTLPLTITGNNRRGYEKLVIRIVARMFPNVYNPTQTGTYFSATPVLSKTSYDLATICVGLRAVGLGYPVTVLRQQVDIGWSELVFETIVPAFESQIILDVWRDSEISNLNPERPMQIFDVSAQIV